MKRRMCARTTAHALRPLHPDQAQHSCECVRNVRPSPIMRALSLNVMQDEEGQQKGKDAMVAELRKLIKAMAPASAGPFFLGRDFSFVDVALAPFYLRILWMGKYYRNLELPEDDDFARLGAWWRATKERPSVKATLVCRERLIMSSSQYAKNQATSDVANQTRAGMKK